jgi:hypothetical protein
MFGIIVGHDYPAETRYIDDLAQCPHKLLGGMRIAGVDEYRLLTSDEKGIGRNREEPLIFYR